MPNAKAHLTIGITAGAVVNLAMQLDRMTENPDAKFDFGELLLCAATAGAAAMLPDILEPATSPHHRKFCHSVAAASLVAYAITGEHVDKCTAAELLLLAMFGVGYGSHLAADALTPKSLPLI